LPYSSVAILFLINGIIPPQIKEVELFLPEVISALKTILLIVF